MTFLRGEAEVGLSVKDRVVERIAFAREHGADLDAAVKEGFLWLKSERLAEALFEEVGLSVLRSLWWDREHATRKAVTSEEPCEAPVEATKPVREYKGLAGRRVGYMLDRAFGTDATPLRFYDAAACDAIICSLAGSARGQYARIKFFRNVKRGLGEGRVEDVYTDEQLLEMWKRVGA